MKPLISYYGGKQKMAPKIVPLIPPHTVYCEPFAGGAAVFYAKPQHTPSNTNHYREVLNDISGDLVNMYMVAKRSPLSFASTIKAIPFSAAVHRGAKQECRVEEERAVSFFVNNQQSFANVHSGGWQRGTYGCNLSSTWARSVQRAEAAADRLSDVSLDNIDAISFIRKWDSPQTFFYVDPPYVGTRCDGMGKWETSDLSALIKTLNEAKGSFILSEYNLRDAEPHKAVKISFTSHCSASGAGKTAKTRNHGEPIKSTGKERVEMLWMRGPTAPVRSGLLTVLEKQKVFSGPLLGPCPLPLKDHVMSPQAKAIVNQEKIYDA